MRKKWLWFEAKTELFVRSLPKENNEEVECTSPRARVATGKAPGAMSSLLEAEAISAASQAWQLDLATLHQLWLHTLEKNVWRDKAPCFSVVPDLVKAESGG